MGELDIFTRELFLHKTSFEFCPQSGNRERRQDLSRLFQHFLNQKGIQFTLTKRPERRTTLFNVWCDIEEVINETKVIEYSSIIRADTITLTFYKKDTEGELRLSSMGWLFWNREYGFFQFGNFPGKRTLRFYNEISLRGLSPRKVRNQKLYN